MAGTTVLYGVGIQEAIAEGDVVKMKSLLKQAEKHLKEYGNIATLTDLLRIEIKKIETHRKKGRSSN